MKNLFILTSSSVIANAISDPATTAAGTLAVIDNTDYLSFYLYRGKNIQPLVVSILDKKDASYTTTEYTKAVPFKATLTGLTLSDDTDFEVEIVKLGVQFNERNRWLTSVHKTADTTTVALLAAKLAKQINYFATDSKITAEVNGTSVVLNGPEDGQDYKVTFKSITRNETNGHVSFTTTYLVPTIVQGTPGIADTKYVKDLASQCAAGKGFEYTAKEDLDIYPGYPEEVADESYNILNIAYYNHRAAGKTRDEVQRQYLHIAVPVAKKSLIATITAAIDGTSAAAAAE